MAVRYRKQEPVLRKVLIFSLAYHFLFLAILPLYAESPSIWGWGVYSITAILAFISAISIWAREPNFDLLAVYSWYASIFLTFLNLLALNIPNEYLNTGALPVLLGIWLLVSVATLLGSEIICFQTDKPDKIWRLWLWLNRYGSMRKLVFEAAYKLKLELTEGFGLSPSRAGGTYRGYRFRLSAWPRRRTRLSSYLKVAVYGKSNAMPVLISKNNLSRNSLGLPSRYASYKGGSFALLKYSPKFPVFQAKGFYYATPKENESVAMALMEKINLVPEIFSYNSSIFWAPVVVIDKNEVSVVYSFNNKLLGRPAITTEQAVQIADQLIGLMKKMENLKPNNKQ